jgi:hypothetical protein
VPSERGASSGLEKRIDHGEFVVEHVSVRDRDEIAALAAEIGPHPRAPCRCACGGGSERRRAVHSRGLVRRDRGLRKADRAINKWFKGVAPSTELRRWSNHDLERWP